MPSDARDRVRETLTAALVALGVPAGDAADPGKRILDLIWDEDATFQLIPGVQRDLGISVPLFEWESVWTIGDMVELLARYCPSAD